MNNLAPSLIRTYVPMVVGAVAAWLLSKGIVLDPNAANGLVLFLGGVLSGAYYLIARLLEHKFPQLGWLLGSAKKPQYVEPLPKYER